MRYRTDAVARELDPAVIERSFRAFSGVPRTSKNEAMVLDAFLTNCRLADGRIGCSRRAGAIAVGQRCRSLRSRTAA